MHSYETDLENRYFARNTFYVALKTWSPIVLRRTQSAHSKTDGMRPVPL